MNCRLMRKVSVYDFMLLLLCGLKEYKKDFCVAFLSKLSKFLTQTPLKVVKKENNTKSNIFTYNLQSQLP